MVNNQRFPNLVTRDPKLIFIRLAVGCPPMQPYVIVIIVIMVIMIVVGIIFSIIAGQANYRSVYGLEQGTMKT